MLVGYPDRSYLWIMTRRWDYPTEEYAKLEARCVDEFGYPKEKIVLVPQQWASDADAAAGGGKDA